MMDRSLQEGVAAKHIRTGRASADTIPAAGSTSLPKSGDQ